MWLTLRLTDKSGLKAGGSSGSVSRLPQVTRGTGRAATRWRRSPCPRESCSPLHDEVYRNTVDFVAKLQDEDLDRVVDTRFVPPVTLGVRLGSVIADDLQHAGQAAYVRGIVLRR